MLQFTFNIGTRERAQPRRGAPSGRAQTTRNECRALRSTSRCRSAGSRRGSPRRARVSGGSRGRGGRRGRRRRRAGRCRSRQLRGPRPRRPPRTCRGGEARRRARAVRNGGDAAVALGDGRGLVAARGRRGPELLELPSRVGDRARRVVLFGGHVRAKGDAVVELRAQILELRDHGLGARHLGLVGVGDGQLGLVEAQQRARGFEGRQLDARAGRLLHGQQRRRVDVLHRASRRAEKPRGRRTTRAMRCALRGTNRRAAPPEAEVEGTTSNVVDLVARNRMDAR